MPRSPSSERPADRRFDQEKIMDAISLDTKVLDPVVVTFALTACFAVTCVLAIVATAGVLGQ
jgi:hypothetical protein